MLTRLAAEARAAAPAMTVAEPTHRAGYASEAALSRAFRRTLGRTPRARG